MFLTAAVSLTQPSKKHRNNKLLCFLQQSVRRKTFRPVPMKSSLNHLIKVTAAGLF